jgi:hypothetical protein
MILHSEGSYTSLRTGIVATDTAATTCKIVTATNANVAKRTSEVD